jgi:hypothetical protein
MALVVDETEVAREGLASVLSAFVRFTRSGDLLLQADFEELDAERKVLCLLLAMRAANLLGLRAEPGALPRELVLASGMPGGTVRPKLSGLLEQRLIARDGGRYVVPAHAITRVASLIGGGRLGA